jgi:hypothetical protein
MSSRFAKVLVGLAVTGGTLGLGLGLGSAISSAAGNSSSTTNPKSPSTTAPSTNRHCPHMGEASTSAVGVY